jgi:hypothetical protein
MHAPLGDAGRSRAGSSTGLAIGPDDPRVVRSVGDARGRSLAGAPKGNVMLRGVLFALVVFVALALAATARAMPAVAGAPAADHPTVRGTRADFVAALRAPVEGYLAASTLIQLRLVEWGSRLVALLTGLALTWLGLRALLELAAPGRLLAELLLLFLAAGLLFTLLDRWPAVCSAVIEGTRVVALQASGNEPSAEAMLLGVSRVLDAAFALWEYPVAWRALGGDWLLVAFTVLFKLGALAFMVGCGIVYLAVYLLSMTLLAIAFALGPVLLPWLLVPWAAFLAEAWLRFCLSAALHQVVGIVMVTLVSAMHEPLLASLDRHLGEDPAAFNFFYFAGALLLGGVSAFMMLQVPALAGALVHGGVPARALPGAGQAAAAARVLRVPSPARLLARARTPPR